MAKREWKMSSKSTCNCFPWRRKRETLMRSGNFRTLAAIGAGLICAALTACLDEKVAGGTGIGNPSGTAEFAVIATSTSTTGLAKTGGGTVRNPDSSFTVRDLGGTAFTIYK